jgi:hypothetical protein
MTTFKEATLDGLDTLVGLWDDGNAFRNCGDHGGCFWMAGNLFHTAVESMYRVQFQKDPFGIGDSAQKYFAECVPDTGDPREWHNKYGFWVDDYGWWGLGFFRAYVAADQLHYDPSLKAMFARNAKNCWEALNACWNNKDPITWRKDGKDYKITGGIPNTSKGGTLAGRNCVTNECYWYLSSYLGGAFGSHYLDPNANAYNFFLQAKDQNILFDSLKLVYERFFGLPNTDDPNWTWVGDQGLFAGCSYSNRQGPAGVFDWYQVIEAVKNNRKTANGVLHEDLAPYTDYKLDYSCGKGTFMRYLAYINDSQHHDFPGSHYDSYISLNAKAVWKNRQLGIFRYYWDAELSEPDLETWAGYRQNTVSAVLHAAGLSALNAALPWLEDQPIDQ